MNIRKPIMIFMMNYLNLNSQLKYRTVINGLLIILLSAVVLLGCKKPEDIGQNIVALDGDHLNANFTDTVSVRTYSLIVDSIPTKSVDRQMLGAFFDPIFGSTAAGIYTQIRLANNDLDFGTNAVCDSIVFGLDYDGFYGDTAAIQHIKIFELDEDMYDDSAYYSNKTLAIKQPALYDEDVVFNLTDSIQLAGGKARPHLRMNLPKSFGDDIISKSGQIELSNNEEFLKFIKGFYLIADEKTQGGGMAYIDLISNYSRITLYYHNDDGDTTYEYFLINDNCALFSQFNHFDYYNSSPNFYNQVVLEDTTLGSQECYVQPMSGIRTYVNFPYIQELKKDNQLAIQKAELIVNVSGISDTADYPIPLHISLVGINKDGVNILLTDYNEGPNYFGGTYIESKNQYVFNITHTVQEMLLETSIITGMRLIVSGEAVIANRAVFNGNNASIDRTRLRLYFTDVIP